LILIASSAALAQKPVSEPACSEGVCVVNVVSSKLITAPCVGYSVLIGYSQNSGATLIQCSKPARAQDNKILVYDRHGADKKAFLFNGGRFIRPDYLATAETEGIPDQFGPVKLCGSGQHPKIQPEGLLIVEKRPDSSGKESPYCYGVNLVTINNKQLQITRDDGRQPPSPLTDAEQKQWVGMQKSTRKYIGAANRPSPEK
jgi:hypothetical protein